LSGVAFALKVQPCEELCCSTAGFLFFFLFDVATITLLMKVKSLVANFAKQFGHWMSKFDHDVD
jgi:hypothetical protein